MIWTTPNGSAPGLDDILFKFYKAFIDEIAPILVSLFNESGKAGSFPVSFCRMHIVLLPKADDTRQLENWRPISLSGGDIGVLTVRMHDAAYAELILCGQRTKALGTFARR
jgi:hypothetical protein